MVLFGVDFEVVFTALRAWGSSGDGVRFLGKVRGARCAVEFTGFVEDPKP